MLRTILLLKLKSLKAQLQYPASFVAQIFSISLTGLLALPALAILTRTFPTVGGWDFYKLGFMSALALMAHGLHHGLFFPFYDHREMVWRGDFDRLLVRPLSPVLQIMAGGLNLSAIGEFVPGLVFLLITAPKATVAWRVPALAYLALVVLSGAVIEWALDLFFMTFDFWLPRATLAWLPISFMSGATSYPIHIYGTALASILTFVLPYAFIAYYPTHVFFGLEGTLYWNGLIYAAPVVAVLAAGVALAFWSVGLRHYQSTGG